MYVVLTSIFDEARQCCSRSTVKRWPGTVTRSWRSTIASYYSILQIDR